MKYKHICKGCGREFESDSWGKICISCLTGDENSVFKCKLCGAPIKYRAVFCSSSCRSKYNVSVYQPFADPKISKHIHETRREQCKDETYRRELDNKIKNTKLEHFGDPNFNNREKAKQTCLEKYGVEHNWASDDPNLNGRATKRNYSPERKKEVYDKVADTTFERYGVRCIFQDVDKVMQGKIDASGSIEQSYQKGKENTILNNRKKYGVDWYTQTDEYKNRAAKTRENNIKEKGYFQASQLNLSDELLNLIYDRDKSIDFLSNKKYSIGSLIEYFGCSETAIQNWIARLDLYDYIHILPGSRYERELEEILPKDFKSRDRKALGNGKELDFYSKERNIAIEFNGTYRHSSLFKSKTYHEDKSKLAEENGFRLIHIYEYEWNDPIKKQIIMSILNLITNNNVRKVYARKCSIVKLTNKDVKKFNEINHLQGHRNAKITYGLVYDNELLQIMSFSKHNKYEWEIIRECTKLNTMVVGGVSKLFKHFIKENNPNQIFSYCDFNHFSGKSYEKLGMKFIGYTSPDMKWVINGEVFNRNPSKHKELKELADAQIFGAGSKKYLWEA